MKGGGGVMHWGVVVASSQSGPGCRVFQVMMEEASMRVEHRGSSGPRGGREDPSRPGGAESPDAGSWRA